MGRRGAKGKIPFVAEERDEWPVAERFFGRYGHSLDTKGRIVLPAKFRASFETRIFLTQQSERCVALWTPDEFERVFAEMAQMQTLSASERNRVRLWSSNVAEVEIDRQGRVQIPPYLREYAGLEDGEDVLVIGAIERIEVWKRIEWESRVLPSEVDLINPSDPPPVLAPT